MCQPLLWKHYMHCPVNLHKTALRWVLLSSPFNRYWNRCKGFTCFYWDRTTKEQELRVKAACLQGTRPPSVGKEFTPKTGTCYTGLTMPLLSARLPSLLSLFIFTCVSVISDLLLHLFVDIYLLTYFSLWPHMYPRLMGLRKKEGWTPLYLVWGYLFIPWVGNVRFTYLHILSKTYTVIPFYCK